MEPINVIIALFHSKPDPINQKLVFNRLKAVINQYKNLKTLNKKLNRVQFSINDVMNGLDGLDRINSKLTDQSNITTNEYTN